MERTESTGCKGCDRMQKLTGDSMAMCHSCWIAYMEWEIEQDKAKIKELKAKELKLRSK